MTIETLTNPLFITAYVAVIVFASWAIAAAITALQDRANRKKLDAISAKYAARRAADDAKHAAFMAEINRKLKS
jgi:hypothetical protein